MSYEFKNIYLHKPPNNAYLPHFLCYFMHRFRVIFLKNYKKKKNVCMSLSRKSGLIMNGDRKMKIFVQIFSPHSKKEWSLNTPIGDFILSFCFIFIQYFKV